MIAEKGRWLGSMSLILVIQIRICMNISSLFMISLKKLGGLIVFIIVFCPSFWNIIHRFSSLHVTLIWNKFFWHFLFFERNKAQRKYARDEKSLEITSRKRCSIRRCKKIFNFDNEYLFQYHWIYNIQSGLFQVSTYVTFTKKLIIVFLLIIGTL